MNKVKKIIASNLLLIFLLILDILVVVLHLFFKKSYGFFNLDKEQNLASVYSGLKLMLVGVLALGHFFIARLDQSRSKLSSGWWLGVTLLFFYLSLDEMMELHERTGFVLNNLTGFKGFPGASFNWLIYFSLLIITALLFLARLIYWFWLENKRLAVLLLAGTAFFVLALAAELIGGKIIYVRGVISRDFSLYFTFIILEEFFEMAGASFFLAGLAFSGRLAFNKIFARKL